MLKALAYIHALGICHKDIQPNNILIDSSNNLKLCDFGSAKVMSEGESSVSYIVSRHYRAPELIFGSTSYDTSIDLWSAACIIGELILGKPLFCGGNHVEQLVEIVKVLGTPSKEQVQDMNPDYKMKNFPFVRPKRLEKIFKPKHCPMAADLLACLLKYSPSKRKPAIECLAHPFFDELRVESAQVNDTFFEFSEEELRGLSQNIVDKLTIPVKAPVPLPEVENSEDDLSVE